VTTVFSKSLPCLALSGNGKEFLNPILDPHSDPDHYQNIMTSILCQV